MSINLITGVPGCGKTYFGADILKEAYDKKERPVFTNINLKADYDEYLNPLNVDDLYNFAKDELEYFEEYKENHEDSRNYDKELKESGLLKKYGGCLIVWDECHNDLQDRDKVWLRFFSYHRHFEGIDIWLITQNLSLIDRKYKSFFDLFYYGQNAQKRIFGNVFRYKVYTDSREFSKFHVENISLKTKKSVFDFYDSGHYEVGKSAFKRFFFLPVILIIILYFVITRFIANTTSDEQVIDNSQKLLSSHDTNFTADDDYEDEKPSFDGDTLIELTCNDSYCYIIGSRFNIPTALLNQFVETNEGEVVYMVPFSEKISNVFVSIPLEKYEDIKKFEIDYRSDSRDKKVFGSPFNSHK